MLSDSLVGRRTARRPFGNFAPIAPRTEVRVGGRVVAWADATAVPGPTGDTLEIHVECASGHQPPWARRLLVHDLLNRAGRAGIAHVTLSCPLGDIEIIDAVAEHCRSFTSRSAGSTCIVDADLRATLQPARAG